MIEHVWIAHPKTKKFHAFAMSAKFSMCLCMGRTTGKHSFRVKEVNVCKMCFRRISRNKGRGN